MAYYVAVLSIASTIVLAPPPTKLSFVASVLAAVAALLYPTIHELFVKPWHMISRMKAQGIPGCPFRPLLGDLPEMFALESARMKDADLAARTKSMQFMVDGTRKLGKFWTWSMGTAPRIVLADPTLIRSAMVTHTQFLGKPQELALLKLFTNGLASSEGALWAKQRRLLTPAFDFVQLRRMLGLMARCTIASVKQWENKVAVEPQGTLEMDRELCNLTLCIIVMTAFGESFEEGDTATLDKIQDAFKGFSDNAAAVIFLSLIFPLYPYLPTAVNRRLWAAESFLRKTTKSLISERMKQARGKERSNGGVGEASGRVDLLQLMLDAREGEEESNESKSRGDNASAQAPPLPMSEQQIMAECLTFFFAGHETTARLLSWTMVMLSQHKEWQERARAEVMQLSKGKGENWVPDFDDLSKLKVVTWILQEVLRLYPPVPMMIRTATKDMKLSEAVTVPEGCTVMIAVEVVHTMEEFWGSNASEFNPERFEDGVSKAANLPGAYIPFGLGPRVCIGQNFAMLEAKLILVLLLRNFSWTMADSYKHHPTLVLTNQPKHGLPVVMTKL